MGESSWFPIRRSLLAPATDRKEPAFGACPKIGDTPRCVPRTMVTMASKDDPNPGGARWCEEHQRWECTKQRRKGRGQCHGAAIPGTNACRLHVGVKIDIAKAQGKARITAWNATGNPDINYRMAVLSVLQMTWLRLAGYSELLRQQVNKESMVINQDGSPCDGDGETSGLIGYRYGAGGKDGRVYVQSEEVRALVALEAAERDRVVKFAKVAHDMGISDRMTSLAERWGDVVASNISMMLDALDLTPEQYAKVPGLLVTHLGSIDVDAVDINHGARTNGGRPLK